MSIRRVSKDPTLVAISAISDLRTPEAFGIVFGAYAEQLYRAFGRDVERTAAALSEFTRAWKELTLDDQ